MNGVKPYRYLKAVLEAVATDQSIVRIDDLLPWTFAEAAEQVTA